MPEGSDLGTLWNMVREARDLFRGAAEQAEGRERELDGRLAVVAEQGQSVAARAESLNARERSLTEERAALDERDSKATAREKALVDRETDVGQRELNAEAGFSKERQEMLSLLDQAREAVRSEFAEKWQASEARLKERENVLDQRADQIAAKERELASRERELGYDEEELAELRAHLDEQAEQRAAASREELEHRIRSVEAQRDQARRDRDNHAERIRQHEDADRKFGQRSPTDVLEELGALRTKNDKLEKELAERPDADAATRLIELERERETWQAERAELGRTVSEYKVRLARADIDANERESQRDVIESLRSQRELLQKAHEDLRAEVDDLHRRSEARTPFAACTGMDEDPESQLVPRIDTEPLELKAFVEDLQQRIATTQSERLYYSLSDLRSFIGGLAMGRLILLQGISGTGKTSLPVAFARAVGTGAAEIKVQAGWRDPQDLIGHYNTFEKRFHETEFLKALYRAGSPRWKDTIQVVLLDEMNLSHPEQYFSDLLSTLELPKEDQRLDLMAHTDAAVPALLDKEGKLPVPPNIWFVGTANHDETTMDFADKTYDRSHVMEFPVRPVPFETRDVAPRPPIAFSALQQAFDDATREGGAYAEKAIGYLDARVREPLAESFRLGWGPRLVRQMRRFVPVVVAAGGTVGEATDHMLAMRLLRKLQNRHDNRPEHVDDLKRRIRQSWSDLDKEPPTKSIGLLDAELRRLGQDPENGE